MAQLNKDLHLTAEFVTLLRAGFYGQILFEGALQKLDCALVPTDYLETAHKAFDKLDVWIKDLANELPIFATSWTSAETFDAISAMTFLQELKKELLWLIPLVEDALRVPNLSQERQSVKLLAASILRSAATRTSYVETLSSIFNQLRAANLAQQVALEIDGSREYLQVGNVIVNTFSSTAAYDDTLCEQLRAEASLTPSDFRAMVHDANILLNVYAKEFTFDLAEIPVHEASNWQKHGIPAVAAGYWRAYEFSPEEFLEWRSVQITGAPLAANWRRAQFTPKEAIEWIQQGLPPSMAIPWRAAGFTPERSAALISRGITDPSRAPDTDRSNADRDDAGE